MIIKRKYGLPYNDEHPWLNYCRGLVIDYKENKVVFIPPIPEKMRPLYRHLRDSGFKELK